MKTNDHHDALIEESPLSPISIINPPVDRIIRTLPCKTLHVISQWLRSISISRFRDAYTHLMQQRRRFHKSAPSIGYYLTRHSVTL